MTSKNYRATFLYYVKFCASFQSHWWIQLGIAVRKRPNSGQNRWFFFVPCDLENWQITLINTRAPFLYHFKLCASLPSHFWIQIGVTVQKRPIWVKIDDLCAVWSWITRWPWKKIEHLFCSTSSFVHHHIAICKFKMKLIRKPLNWVLTSVTLTVDHRPWPLHGHHPFQY